MITEPTAECVICYHVGPCYGEGEAAICTNRAACRARCAAALDGTGHTPTLSEAIALELTGTANPICERCGAAAFISVSGHLYCKSWWQYGDCDETTRGPIDPPPCPSYDPFQEALSTTEFNAQAQPAAGAVYCTICEGPAAPPAYNNGVPLCEACAIAQDEPVSEFYAAAQPPTPACHCGAPATILVREGLALHDLCDTCFQRDFQDNEERHTAWEVMEPPPHATMDEVVEWAYARRHVPLADEERYTHMHAPAPPEISDEEAIRIEALALLDAGADYCTVCGLSHRPTQCPEIGALLFRSAPAPLSPVEALRLAINKGVFGESTLAILRASLEAADEEALIKAEQLASAREHAGQTWETWQEERAAGAPF